MSFRPAINGLVPTVDVDVPITSVFLALFIGMAVSHMSLFIRNRKRDHFFVFNAVLFGFSMSRIAACVMRIVWATRPTNVDIQLAAQVFVNAGILLVYIINLILAQRILRSAAPRLGWHPVPRTFFKVMLWILLPMIIMFIIIIVYNIKGPVNPTASRASRDIQLLGQTYFLVMAVMPVFVLSVAFALNRSSTEGRDEFGEGSFRTKSLVLVLTTALAITEAGYRAGSTWETPRPMSNPAWYHGRPAFYCFNFMIDIFILAVFLAGRIDKRFFVRSKANGPWSYSTGVQEDTERKENDDSSA